MKMQWQERKRNDKRNNRFRKIALTKTHAPFNNNQFLMEIHKPEPENSFQIPQTPSARTRDSSFSVDSEENYFYSLPEDEEDFLTKEFSSVYEDAQSERLSNMSKNELIQEYLLLEAKYDTLIKRTERSKTKDPADDRESSMTDKDSSVTESMVTDKDTSATSLELSTTDEPSIQDLLLRLKEQEDHIMELKHDNEKLQQENEHLHLKSQRSSSEDSESDSSSTSISSSSSSRAASPSTVNNQVPQLNGHVDTETHNGVNDSGDLDQEHSLVNGLCENGSQYSNDCDP